MRQTTLSVPLEVKPESYERLIALIDGLRTQHQPAGYPDQYQRLLQQTPVLHFMSLSVFPHPSYDPLFVLEANFDGPAGVFWGQLEATFGDELRAMLRCCKRPLDKDGPLYAAATAPNSKSPVAPYFEVRTQAPSVFHHGNRGLTRDRILQEAELFLATRTALDPSLAGSLPPAAVETAEALHLRLRAALLPKFPWLDQAPSPRIPTGERIGDICKLALFVVLTLMCLTAPGIALSLVTSLSRYVIVTAGLTIVVALLVFRVRKPRPGEEAAGNLSIVMTLLARVPLLLFLLAVYVAVAATLLVLPAYALLELPWKSAWFDALRAAAFGLLSLPLGVVLLLLWLRHLERRDSTQDAPPTDPATLRAMTQREDWIDQNHMASAVILKAGVLRTVLVKAGHLGLGLVLRVLATDGYLGSMRTVHFAHWAFVNNSSRLIFFSNFDHSWGSYLDDFIEKASGGLTLAWGAGVGFPATRFLVLDGASHGRQFKAWALASRTVSRFWYSAYRDLTVDQIERQFRIAAGLQKATLGEKEAETWRQDL